MKQKCLLRIAFLFRFFTATLFPQLKPGMGTLAIFVDGFSSDKGKAFIALCDSVECYQGKTNPFKASALAAENRQSKWVINMLRYGTYAICVFRDEKGNSKLDTNSFGMPGEKYGFSNNARGVFGPPTFEKAQFDFQRPEMAIHITVR